MTTPVQDNSLTDRYVGSLATPFTGQETRNLVGSGDDRIPVGSGVHVEMIALLFTIFILVLFFTIVLAILYQKYYQSRYNPYKGLTPEEKTALGDDFSYTDYQYVSVVGSLLGIISLVIIMAFLGRWFGIYNKLLIKQNSIAQDIAVAMRGKKAINNVSNLLAASVHPLDNAESKASRELLSTHLNTAVKNGFRYEMNAERGRLGTTAVNSSTSGFFGRGGPTGI